MDYFVFATGEIPDNVYKVAGPPALLAIIAVLIWISGRTMELKHGVEPWKWCAIAPMAMALVLGFVPFEKLSDFLYREAIAMKGSRMENAHFAAFGVPVACIIGLAAFEFFERRVARLAEER